MPVIRLTGYTQDVRFIARLRNGCSVYRVLQDHLIQMFAAGHHGEHVLIVRDRHVNQHGLLALQRRFHNAVQLFGIADLHAFHSHGLAHGRKIYQIFYDGYCRHR